MFIKTIGGMSMACSTFSSFPNQTPQVCSLACLVTGRPPSSPTHPRRKPLCPPSSPRSGGGNVCTNAERVAAVCDGTAHLPTGWLGGWRDGP